MIVKCWSVVVPLALALSVASLGACGGRARPAADVDAAQRQAVERARNLCQDLGYIPGTVDFARCAQSEYDRLPSGAPVASVTPVTPPNTVAAQRPAAPVAAPPQTAPTPAPQAVSPPRTDADEDDWFVRWFKRPNVCQTAACSVR
jgi:hypothetical protein